MKLANGKVSADTREYSPLSEILSYCIHYIKYMIAAFAVSRSADYMSLISSSWPNEKGCLAWTERVKRPARWGLKVAATIT